MTDAADPVPVLDHLLRAAGAVPAPEYPSLEDWWPAFRDARREWPLPIDQALIGGVGADRVGYAFAAGYQAALRRIDPALPRDRMACFSVTEEGGGHPRAVAATLTPSAGGFVLSGKKKWATMSSSGGLALVVASTGEDGAGRKRLRVVRIDLASPGSTVVAMPPTPFCPEIPHCRLELESVAVAEEQLLPGDGYDELVKPFRTHEDIHVGAAILAYVLAVATRWQWPHELREELLQLIVCLRTLALADPTSPTLHLALEGAFKTRHQLLERCARCWESVGEDVRRRWERDATLAGIAGNVRAQRTAKAWQAIENSQD